MACRLEEIPRPGDFAEYEILDQSVLVVRTEDMGVRAFDNVCRHRGVRFAQGRGSKPGGFVCPFHGWCYGTDGQNTRVTQSGGFSEHNLEPAELNLSPVRCETWGGCAWINLDADAPPLRECMEPFATVLDAWKMESLRAEWWYSRPSPRQLEARGGGLRRAVPRAAVTPAAADPGRYPGRDAFDPRGVPRGRAAIPAHDERRHGGHGPRPRPADRRGDGRPGAAGRLQAAPTLDVGPDAQRRRRQRARAPAAATCPT